MCTSATTHLVPAPPSPPGAPPICGSAATCEGGNGAMLGQSGRCLGIEAHERLCRAQAGGLRAAWHHIPPAGPALPPAAESTWATLLFDPAAPHPALQAIPPCSPAHPRQLGRRSLARLPRRGVAALLQRPGGAQSAQHARRAAPPRPSPGAAPAPAARAAAGRASPGPRLACGGGAGRRPGPLQRAAAAVCAPTGRAAARPGAMPGALVLGVESEERGAGAGAGGWPRGRHRAAGREAPPL